MTEIPADNPALLPPEDEQPTVARQQASFEACIGEARALPASEVLPFRADDALAYRNAVLGAKALEQHRTLLSVIPGVAKNVIEQIMMFALALLFAGRRVALAGKSTIQPTQEDMTRLRKQRMLLMHSLNAAALADLVPMEPLEKIEKGRGYLDAAQDVIDYVAFARKHHEALENKTPLTPAMLEEAETLAHDVRELLAVSGSIAEAAKLDVKAASDDRARIWTLLNRAHAQGLVLGTVGYGPAQVKEHVPSLQSRQGLPKKPAAAKPAARTKEA